MVEEKRQGEGYLKKVLLLLLILGIVIAAVQVEKYIRNYGKYSETVCFQSFPNYCEYERVEDKGDGVLFYTPVIPGWMMHSGNPPYSDRRMPQFNFHTIVNVRNDTAKYCRGLVWMTVPCNEPHVVETKLRADNDSVYWWEKFIVPDKMGRYPINKDDDSNYTYL